MSTAVTPGYARPNPGVQRSGFRLLARSIGALTINRVYCGLSATGEICIDSTGSGFAGGGFWPKGTADQYIFNSGFQLAGIVDPTAGFAWAGDTTGAFFFDATGDLFNGEQVQPIFNADSPEDLAAWPEAAQVPDASLEANSVFNPLLAGRASVSQGDVWWLTWDGNPALNAGRSHPLGVLLEQRGMGWNYPAGNEDIVYFVYTIYNITSSDPADYAGIRPALREILLDKAREFQTRNAAEFGIALPPRGYSITNLYVAFAGDMDVANASENYTSVNVPFALGYTYDRRFGPAEGWTFDPAIFAPPFFPGSGFVGVKYLSSPADSTRGVVGLTNFGGYINQGDFGDPSTAPQLYRYLSASLSPAAGDPGCNTGNPKVTHICFVNQAFPADMRFFESTGPLELAPGQSGSIVVAYIFAAPVKTGSCISPCDIRPGDPTILGNAGRMAAGVNPVDSVAGYRGFTDANGDGRVAQDEFRVVPGSLYGKALVAQAVFDNRFLLPFAPAGPDFFLVPGDGRVTVLWRPSSSETEADPFFVTAQQVTVTPAGGGSPVPNPLYDPNYRQFDVEGYRVYRGRVDSPNSLTLLAQFDYAGTAISDYQGQVNPVNTCAPELSITASCPGVYDSAAPGLARTRKVDQPLVGNVVQVRLGTGRIRLATGIALTVAPDTAVTGGGTGNPPLRDTGVPFAFVDRTARNDFRYFYSVTAFDVNSFQSGPSSLESPRRTAAAVPQRAASNYAAAGTLSLRLAGRNGPLPADTLIPRLDPVTGRFAGRFPPADNIRIGFAGDFIPALFSGTGTFSVRLTGLGLGDSRNDIPTVYSFLATSATGDTTAFAVPVLPGTTGDSNTTASGIFPAAPTSDALAGAFGARPGYVMRAELEQGLVSYTATNAWGRGAADSTLQPAEGTTGVDYNGPRWFADDGETRADPNRCNVAATAIPDPPCFDNAGELPGVATIQYPLSYGQFSSGWRTVEAVLSGAVRAADFGLYWGEGGRVDSIVDLTHDVPVPFMAESLGGGWGILNPSAAATPGSFDARPDVLTITDFGCVLPLQDSTRAPDVQGPSGIPCSGPAPYRLSAVAIPGPVAFFGGALANAATAPVAPGPGFGLYVAGHPFLVQLAPGGSVPPPGTVWTLRSYIGYVSGGNGAAGAEGPYTFTPAPRTFSALGAEAQVTYQANSRVAAATEGDLSHVHTVPDPYYVTNRFEQTTETKIIKFVNLPNDCIIRIYSSSGVLVSLLEHHSATFGGSENWDVRNRNSQVVASGVYFYHIEAGDARRVGRMTVVNFAE